jgi:hypothetical protein
MNRSYEAIRLVVLAGRIAVRFLARVVMFLVLALLAIGAIGILVEGEKKPVSPEQAYKSQLCRVAAACKKYDQARLDCATAGNFKTCLRIKMGHDEDFISACSGYVEGAPAVPLSVETPNSVNCFFRTLSQ